MCVCLRECVCVYVWCMHAHLCVCVSLPSFSSPSFLSSSLFPSFFPPLPFPVARTIIIKIQWNPLRLSSHVKWCVNDSSMCVIMCVRICAALRKCVWIWVFVFAYMWIHVCICVFADCCLG